jgi:hypothetical protein
LIKPKNGKERKVCMMINRNAKHRPHEYREHYAICDRVEVCTKDSIQQALDQDNIHNTKFAKRILKFRRRNLRFNLDNFGFHQDMLVWIDIGDYVQI